MYDKYHEGIYRFLRLKLPDDQTAQDLTAETFMRTWGRISQNDENYPDNERAYLYKTAYHCAADYYRSNKNKEVAIENEGLIDYLDNKQGEVVLSSSGQKLDTALEMSRVQKALSGLSEQNAELITLKYIEDMSNAEIAEVLGKNEGAVRTGLSRAMKELRELLATDY